MNPPNKETPQKIPSVSVKINEGSSNEKSFIFNWPFKIGRDEECEICINDGIVSRKHIEVAWIGERWWITDLDSANGTFLNGEKLKKIELENELKLKLGSDGPELKFKLIEQSEDTESIESQKDSVDEYINHYFDNKGGREAGEHTMMIRQAFDAAKKKHSSKFVLYIIIIAAIALIAVVYAVYQQIDSSKQRSLAESIFYDIKSIELEIGRLNSAIIKTGDQDLIESLYQLQSKRLEMENKYDNYISDLGVYDDDEETQLIVNIARTFGECELKIPSDFIDEVKEYIKKWQSSNRLKNAVIRAKKAGYEKIIAENMSTQQLPPHFFYLALQESNFQKKIVGPETRYGIAKGIWQFIPKTALKYGMKLGPLVKSRKYDARDERFNFEKATTAAARYLNDIYLTEAQASGLLVMASYNWGEHRVRKLILEMPGNPEERNFWSLLKNYKSKIPEETYNYVFYIFSAAVIGENPRLFGFDFDNPLENVLE